MNIKKLISVSVLVLMIGLVFGAWIKDYPMIVEQPDGTKINCFATGDEFHNWIHNAEGYTIIQDKDTGYYVWAVKKGEELIASSYRADQTNPLELGLERNANISLAEYKQKKERFFGTNRENTHRAPSSGIINNLVVFIRFSNESEFNQSITQYNNMLNDSTASANSMHNYFKEVSYETLTINSTFYPQPDNGMVLSYQDTHPRSYYLPYNSVTNPTGYTEDNRVEREHTLLANAVGYISDMVPASINLDGDDDGRVDNVCFVIKGAPGDWADLLWPHRWNLYGADAYINGKQVWDFNFQLQTHMLSNGASVLSHEMFHSLGAPDLYRYSYNGDPIGTWDLMASNTNPPQHMGAYMKYRYGFWISDIPTITASGDYSLKSIKSATNNCYKIVSPNNPEEFFVIEYRNTQQGIFDSMLPGSGLLAYRVNSNYDGQGNASGPPDEILLFRPYGDNNGGGNINSAYLSLESGRTSINDSTEPRSYLSDGSNGGLNISNIGTAGDSISFTVTLNVPNPEDIDEDFENGVLTDFDWQNDIDHPWTIVDNGYMSTKSIKSGTISNSQSTSLTQIISTTAGFVQFYYKTSTQANNDLLLFFIDNQLLGEFSGVNSWNYISYNISAGIHELKWTYQKNASISYGSDAVWIDRIGFPDLVGNVYYPPQSLTADVMTRDVLLTWKKPYISNIYNTGSVTGYQIYCNDELLTELPSTDSTYIHASIVGGNLSYKMRAIYQNIYESIFSNVCNTFMPFSAPVNLTGSVTENGVNLIWESPITTRELVGYKVYRNNLSLFTGNRPSTTYLDTTVVEGTTYTYSIKAVYNNPTGISPFSNIYTVTYTDNQDVSLTAFDTKLRNNYPNPFNPSTTIHFSTKTSQKVSIEIYNIKGQLVKRIANGYYEKGNHKVVWNGKDHNNQDVSGGLYFYKMKSTNYTETKKMLLIK